MAAISADQYLNDTSQFDRARNVAQQQSGANLQGRQDALKRRFAQLGNLDSGVALKLQDQASNEEAANLNNANEGINAAQSAEMSRRREVLQGQQFGAEQAALQRAWGSSERTGSQDFSGEQNAMARKQQGEQFGQSLDETKAGRTQQGEQFGQSLGEQQAGRLQQGAQFGQTLGEQQAQRAQQGEQFGETLTETQKQRSATWELARKERDLKYWEGNMNIRYN